jgi:hypothetical protein
MRPGSRQIDVKVLARRGLEASIRLTTVALLVGGPESGALRQNISSWQMWPIPKPRDRLPIRIARIHG